MNKFSPVARFALAWLLVGATPLAAQTIISDMFSGASGASISGATPPTDLPGGTYQLQGSVGPATYTGSGQVSLGADEGVGITIASTGSYMQPSAMTISAGLEVNTVTSSSNPYRGVGIGFYRNSLPDGNNSDSYFAGLVLNPNGTLTFAQNPNGNQDAGSQMAIENVPWPGAGTPSGTNLGDFSTAAVYTVSYTVNTSAANGGISNVSVSNGMFTDSADFAAIDSYSGANLFAGNTAYATFMSTAPSGGETGLISNFLLATANVAPPTGSVWTGAVSGVWATAGNWNGSVPGATSGTASTDSVLFNANNPTNPTPTVDSGRNVQNISFDNSGGNLTTTLTLGTTGGAALLLTAGGTILVNSNVANAQVVNAPLVLEGAAATYTFTNNSNTGTATLSFGGEITAGGSGAETLQLNGTNPGANAISGAIGNGSTGATLGLTVQSGTWVLTGSNTYTGPTAVGPGANLQVSGGSLGATAISITGGVMALAVSAASPTITIGGGSMSVNSGGSLGAATVSLSGGRFTVNSGATVGNATISLTGGTFAALAGSGSLAIGSSGAGSAGATLAVDAGGTFSMADGAIGTLKLQQQSSFLGPALSLNGGTLDFDLGSSGADKLVVGAGQASVSGTNTIGITAIGSSLGAGPYTLISAPAGGLSGTFQFAGGGTTAFAGAGGNFYQLTLNDTNNAVTVSAAPSNFIILDTFTGAAGTPITSHTPDVNLPAGVYRYTGSVGNYSYNLTGTGQLELGADRGIDIPITSQGNYTQPTAMTLSAGMELGTTTGSNIPIRGIGLGFYSSSIGGNLSNNADTYFTGVVIQTNGSITLSNSTAIHQSAETNYVTVPWSGNIITTLGAFSPTTVYTVTYTVNTAAATGGISGVSVENMTTGVTDSVDFAMIDDYSGTNLFSGTTAYFAAMSSSLSAGTNSFLSNFEIQPAGSLAPTSDWTGAADSTWANAGNWTGAVPGSTTGTTNTDTATFNQAAANSPLTIDAGRNVMNITFDTANVPSLTLGTVGGNPLLLTAGGTMQITANVVNPQTIDAPLVLEGNYTFTSNSTNAGASFTFGGTIKPDASLTSTATLLTLNGSNPGANFINGVMSDNGSAKLAVEIGGTSLWVLAGATNTFSGGTTIDGGATLELAGSVSTMSQSMNIANSGSLFVASNTNQMVGTILGSGAVAVTKGSLTAYQIRQNSLTIGSGATVTLSPSGSGSTTNPTGPNNYNFSSSLNSLSIAGTTGAWTGTLDIGNNGLVIEYGATADPYATIDNMIETGFDAAHWDGKGITSSLGRAAANSHTPLNIGLEDFTPGKGNFSNTTFIVFQGQTVTTNALLIRLTYMDDIIMAGDMSVQDAASDALIFAANYGSGTTWSLGDLEHTGLVGSADALLFAANYATGLQSLDGTTGGAVALAGGAAAVPEPASLSLAALAAIGFGLLKLRRRGGRRSP